MDKLYGARMEPAMREYLKTLREQSFVVIKPGYVDAAGGPGNSEIQEVSAMPEASKAKKGRKKFLLFGKRSGAQSEHEDVVCHRSRHGTEHHLVFSRSRKRDSQYPRGQDVLAPGAGDRSGTIEARMWDQFDAAVKDINRDDFVKVQARVEITAIGRSFRCSSFGLRNPRRLTSPIFSCTQKKTLESCTRSCWNTRTRLQIPGSRNSSRELFESGNRREVQARSRRESDASCVSRRFARTCH